MPAAMRAEVRMSALLARCFMLGKVCQQREAAATQR